MLYTALALFVISAVFGLTILLKWLQKSSPSMTVIYTHGIIAAIALVLLIVYAIQNPANFPKVSLVLFIITALFGFYMFIRELMKKFSPLAVAVIHALIAVSSVVALLIFIFA
jgi:hypothetical protein